MKILSIAQKVCYPPKDGSTMRQYQLLREVARRHSVHLVCFNQEDLLGSRDELRQSREVLAGICERVAIFPIPWGRDRFWYPAMLAANLLTPTPYSLWRFRRRDARRTVRAWLAQERYDLIQVNTIALAEYGELGQSCPRIMVHENIESELLARRALYERGPLRRAYLRLQARKLSRCEGARCRSFQQQIVVSDRDRDLLVTMAPGAAISVIPNGTDTEYFRPGDQPEEPQRLVFVGSMNWHPNREGIVFFAQEVWPRLLREIPSLTIDVIGIEPPEQLRVEAERQKGITVHGFVPDIRPFVARAGVYVAPIRFGGGTRLKLLDAMAMGKAIVSTAAGAEGLAVRPGVDLLLADDAAAFAAAVLDLVRDRGLRAALGKQARETVAARYSWSRIDEELEEVYRSVAAPRA